MIGLAPMGVLFTIFGNYILVNEPPDVLAKGLGRCHDISLIYIKVNHPLFNC